MQPSDNRKPLTISFSGIDGAGKSTQIAALIDYLESLGLSVKLHTFWDDVVAFRQIREGAGHKIFKGDKGVGSPDAPIERRDKNIKSPFMSFTRLVLYFFDALSLRRISAKAGKSDADVVIFDRYLYDELANLDSQSALSRNYIRTMMKIAPRTGVAFVLDADPVKARIRKPEYPLDFLIANRNAYLRLAEILGGFTVVTPASIEEAKAQVRERVAASLPWSEARSGASLDAAVERIPA